MTGSEFKEKMALFEARQMQFRKADNRNWLGCLLGFMLFDMGVFAGPALTGGYLVMVLVGLAFLTWNIYRLKCRVAEEAAEFAQFSQLVERFCDQKREQSQDTQEV